MLTLRVQINNERYGSYEWYAWLSSYTEAIGIRQRSSTVSIGKLTPCRRYSSVKGALGAAQRVAEKMGATIEVAEFNEIQWLDGNNRRYVGDVVRLVG
jgi:hypothetical protein